MARLQLGIAVMDSATASRLSVAIVVVAVLSAGCSSGRQEDHCRAAPTTTAISMDTQSSDTIHTVKVGGAVNIARVSQRDTVSFDPANGLSPATVERDNYLPFAAERAGSYTITETDGAGRHVATVRLAVESC